VLAEGDEVLFLGMGDIGWLASPPVQRALRGEAPGQDACAALAGLAVAARGAPARFAHVRGAGFPELGTPECPAVFQEHPALLPFLLDQAVVLTGEARQPGLYPVLPGTTLEAVLATAGGATEGAELASVELTREEPAGLSRSRQDVRGEGAARLRVGPRDLLRIPRAAPERRRGR
jgi:hypothetical protein